MCALERSHPKPSNILLGGDNTAKISDFGLAKLQEDGPRISVSGIAMGTPCYMAPEQARGSLKELGPHTDVYALGAILYELLTGQPPFDGKTRSEVLERVQVQNALSPAVLREGIPPPLENICMRCLEKRPADRYATADLLAEDLERWAAGEEIMPAPSPGKKGGLLVAGLLATIVLAIGVGGYALRDTLFKGGRSPTPPSPVAKDDPEWEEVTTYQEIEKTGTRTVTEMVPQTVTYEVDGVTKTRTEMVPVTKEVPYSYTERVPVKTLRRVERGGK